MKKQNIGVLTFQNTNNYGACLQAVALYKILAINEQVRDFA